jgi:RND family efflux transporter MFP subunit
VQIPVVSLGIGTVRSRRQTQIASRVLAEVKEIRRQPGDRVAAGEPLILLDDRDLVARVQQVEASLRAAEEASRLARIELVRAENLLEREATTKQEHDLASSRFGEASARADAAQKALVEARVQLGHATIAAPFAGVVFEKLADPGDLAVPGKPLLGLYDPAELRLEALVDESILHAVTLREELEVRIDALGGAVMGVVSEAVPAVDPLTRTGVVKIDLPRSPALRPGMFGRALIPTGKRTAVAVPAAAVVRRGQLELVFTVDGARDASGQLAARLAIVRAGEPVPAAAGGGHEDWVEISSGIEAGRRLISSPPVDLRDGEGIEPDAADPGGREKAK